MRLCALCEIGFDMNLGKISAKIFEPSNALLSAFGSSRYVFEFAFGSRLLTQAPSAWSLGGHALARARL
jgi:hypothetical protein